MTLRDQLVEVYPEIVEENLFTKRIIVLQNDSDGYGDYIAEWHFDKPIPAGFKLGKS